MNLQEEGVARVADGTDYVIRFTEIQYIQPKPGEVFVLSFPRRLSAVEHGLLHAAWLRAWPEGNAPKVLILEDGVRLSVAKAGE